jgi:hypothetical protein
MIPAPGSSARASNWRGRCFAERGPLPYKKGIHPQPASVTSTELDGLRALRELTPTAARRVRFAAFWPLSGFQLGEGVAPTHPAGWAPSRVAHHSSRVSSTGSRSPAVLETRDGRLFLPAFSLVLGIALRASRRLPKDTGSVLNGFMIRVPRLR